MISCSAPMRNLSMLTPMVSVFCLFILLYHITTVSSTNPRYIAVDNIKLNCGNDRNLIGSDGRKWAADNFKFFPQEEDNLKSSISEPTEGGTVMKAPYTTARVSYSQFTYVFPVTLGPKFVRLFFHPASYSHFERSTDFFTVKAGAFTLLRNFNASINLVDYKTELVKEFCINVEENQKLNLTFIPLSTSSGNFYAFINGIEIISMPEDLYYSPSEKLPVYVGQSPPQFYINYIMALEMVFRLNVGGGLIQPLEDTGLFRLWSPDPGYFMGGGVLPHNTSLIPIFSKIPNYTAPDELYRSARSMGPTKIKNLQWNLTWRLPVDLGFNYLLRLHFCEIGGEISVIGERRFIIYIDYQLAEPYADVISWTDYDNTPIYKDYVVMIQNKGVDVDKKHTLSIDLHPGTDGTSNDAILNGVEVFKLSNKDRNLAGPEMVPFLPALTTNESKTKKTIIIAIVSGAGFIVVFTSVCCMVLWKLRKSKRYGSYHLLSKWWCWRDPYKGKSTRTKASSLPEERCRHFSLDEIKTATNNFHNELIIGRGGFGNVYKGVIDKGLIDDGMTVAIKRLNHEKSNQGVKEFKTEIEMLSQLRHVHLVSLIGYCNDEGEMILIYDYMTNGTLSDHIYDNEEDHLTWKQRLEICIGAARGLHYLHTSDKNPIIHRDVKTTNILLDENWVSKVSDFGLSKMGLDQTAVSTAVKGTWGYLDPDYARRQLVTEKSDVYSFGVVLFEVLCARKALNPKLEQEQWHLANWARKCIEKGTINQIIDPYLKGKIAPECFKVYVEVAESCVRDQGIQRPTMNDVMEKLEFALELQKNADATQDKVNPNGEITYQGVLSFHVAEPATGASPARQINFGHMLESDSGIGQTTINSGFTNPSLESNSVSGTSRDLFTDNSVTKT
uniref:Protein kinase domain-containing protein n=1 Tax=Fagus sylvatica TaxID=28930 RepID=A0A2N9F9B6_FAGSY